MSGVENVYIKKYTSNIFVDGARCELYGYNDYLLNQFDKYLMRGKISSEDRHS
ncbi:hypothetical protein [Clostridium moutaii]|uniref:hypothetical protein n=1 Tax=Clostridium moutaii TaxID=3240932 RepID=UPI0035102748